MKQLLRRMILSVVRVFGLVNIQKTASKDETKAPNTLRILLIRPDHLGDLVLTTPILHALKTRLPEASITMMVGPWSSEVVARHPDIDTLIPFPFPGFQRAAQRPLAPYFLLFSVAKQLRRGKYDLAINLRPDFWWGSVLLYLAKIPLRIGYAVAPGTPFLTKAIPLTVPEHATVSNLRLVSAALEALGQAPLATPFTPEHYPLQFLPTVEEQQWVAERLSQAGIAAEEPIVVIHPGTGAAVKLWRTEAWSTIANDLPKLLTVSASSRIILTGSNGERPMLEKIAMGIEKRDAPPLLLTDMTVGQLAALLQRAQMVLGVDSGPLHLAVAQRTPTLHIFGPTDPRIFGPWGNSQRHTMVAATQRCPGCPRIPCDRLDFRPDELPAHPCVRLIPEQRVEEVLRSIIPTKFNKDIPSVAPTER